MGVQVVDCKGKKFCQDVISMYECKRPEVKYYYNYGTVGWKTFVGSLIFYAVVLNASATTFTSTDSELQEMILICLTYGLTLFAVKGVVGRYAGYVNPAQIINDAIYSDEFVRTTRLSLLSWPALLVPSLGSCL